MKCPIADANLCRVISILENVDRKKDKFRWHSRDKLYRGDATKYVNDNPIAREEVSKLHKGKGEGRVSDLGESKSIFLEPRSPYNFDANFHKPSHFPSSDNSWQPGVHWITMVWRGRILGLMFQNKGSTENPRMKLTVYSKRSLTDKYFEGLKQEIKWRFNFDQDVSEFCLEYEHDDFLEGPMKRLKGMKPIAANSLYETLAIYVVLQNATVKRSVQMLESLFWGFGQKVSFDSQTLSTFWHPRFMARSTEDDLRSLKLGYRAKFMIQISEQFANGVVDEFALRKMSKEMVRKELDNLYGIGPASIEYLLFEDFYFLDALETIPPWEQRITARLLFKKPSLPVEKILRFFKQRYGGYEKLAFHYLWEDLFWRRREERIEWLEKEIRL